MFRHIVAAVDGSVASQKALDRALVLAAKVGASLDIVSVEEELPHYLSRKAELTANQSDAERYYGQLHAEAVVRAAQLGVTTTTKIIAGHEVYAIVQYVRERAADLLVIGAIGHSAVWSIFLGSTADKLVAHSPTSILVVHPNDIGQFYRELVVGVDGSPAGEYALTLALELGRAFSGKVRGVTVAEQDVPLAPGRRPPDSDTITQIQARARSIADAAGLSLELATRHGHAGSAVVQYANEVDADLIVVGATGTERPGSETSGGTARRIANEGHCSVLLARPPQPNVSTPVKT